jgi:hypothetical protein
MGFNLQPSDIDTMEEAGMLDGQPIKLVRTKGGFWMAANHKGVLAAGSHPAIVKHQLSKMFPNFQAAMCKSENFSDALVDKHSHFLSDDLRKSGHDVYSIQNGNEIEFQITKQNVKVASVNTTIVDDSLFIPELDIPKEFARAMAGAATEKALFCNAKTIKVK